MTNSRDNSERKARLRKRKRAEIRFQWYGRIALSLGMLALVVLLWNIASGGLTAFERTVVTLEVPVAAELLEADADYKGALVQSLYQLVGEPDSSSEKRELRKLFSAQAPLELQRELQRIHPRVGTPLEVTVSTSSDVDQLVKGKVSRALEPLQRRVSDAQLAWIDLLQESGRLKVVFNTYFFTHGDSRDPEQAGIAGALLGSFFALFVCFSLSFPIGIAAAIYLEEFAPRNRITEFLEININNLAAVPSIIFGLLGLAVLLNLFGLPRSTPLVGGTVLALMTLPTIIIACRASLRAVPSSIRDGALALGASKTQAIFMNVLPLALPGTLTGTIIGLSQALGETAPLLMIGMVAFIADVPSSPVEPAAALPVQIYLWAESAERGFHEKTAAAIIVILGTLLCMNAVAVFLRNRLERKW